MTDRSDEIRLRELFDAHAHRVLAYARRHVDGAAAEDVVSEVFLTAWRRMADIPDEPLPWLLGVARNTVSNRVRSVSRQQRLADRIVALDSAAATSPGAEHEVVERQAMVGALADLSDAEREALLLTAWDGLTAAQAAVAAGCSRHAFEVRLNRARSRLTRSLLHADHEPTNIRSTSTVTASFPARLPTQEVTA